MSSLTFALDADVLAAVAEESALAAELSAAVALDSALVAEESALVAELSAAVALDSAFVAEESALAAA